jgi:hypothetical protein
VLDVSGDYLTRRRWLVERRTFTGMPPSRCTWEEIGTQEQTLEYVDHPKNYVNELRSSGNGCMVSWSGVPCVRTTGMCMKTRDLDEGTGVHAFRKILRFKCSEMEIINYVMQNHPTFHPYLDFDQGDRIDRHCRQDCLGPWHLLLQRRLRETDYLPCCILPQRKSVKSRSQKKLVEQTHHLETSASLFIVPSKGRLSDYNLDAKPL